MKKKLLAGLLTLTMLCSLLPSAAFAGGVADSSNASKGHDALTLNESVVAFAGYEWYVIGDTTISNNLRAPTNCITLLSKNYEKDFGPVIWRAVYPYNSYLPEGFKHSDNNRYSYGYKEPFINYANEYEGSVLLTKMTEAAQAIQSEDEKNLIHKKDLKGSDIISPNMKLLIAGPDVLDQCYWPLSFLAVEEMANNGPLPGEANEPLWWTRTPTSANWKDEIMAASRLNDKLYSTSGEWCFMEKRNGHDVYMRPAMYLNVKDAFLLSSVADGKPEALGTFKKMEANPTGTLKFTMKTDKQRLTVDGVTGQTDTGYTVSYSGATTGDNQYISMALCDSANKVQYYGKLKKADQSSGNVEIPKKVDGKDVKDYTVNLFAEQSNSGNYTDFCSVPKNVDLSNIPVVSHESELLSVHGQAVNVTSGSGTVKDYCKATVHLDETYKKIEAGDLKVSDKATVGIYNQDFTQAQAGIVLADGENHLYVKVTAEDGTTTKYYDVTIPRESAPTPPPAPSGDNYVIIVENDGHGSASATIGKDHKVTLTATPHSDYVFDKWEVTPADVKIENNSFTMPKSNVTVKAHFKANAPIPDPKPEEQGFDVMIHPASSGAHYKLVSGDATQNNVTGAIEKIVFKAEDGYVFPDAVVESVNGITGKVSDDGKTLTITGTPSDNVDLTMLAAIPEEKVPAPQAEATVTFRVENGTWDDGTAADRTVKVALKNDKGTLQEAEIPTGMKAKDGYEGGEWDVVPNTAVNGITGNVTYSYRFTKQSGGSGGGGAVTTKYTLTYESNGGTEYDSERYRANKVVSLDKVPTRERYQFTGWYADKALTQKIDSIKMTSDKTVYAGWKRSGDGYIPEDLNSKDHVAYVSGYEDGTVKPDNSITRAETASMLYRLLTDERRDEITTLTHPFGDMTADDWYAQAVASMANGGYIAGYEDGTFGGNNRITRAEFVAMLVRFIGPEAADCTFSDVPKSHWAYSNIATATNAGWISGYPDGTFGPNRNISRAEAMSIINRVLDRGVDANSTLLDFKQWPDNPKNAWYYYEVIEATNEHEYTGSRPSEDWTSLEIG